MLSQSTIYNPFIVSYFDLVRDLGIIGCNLC